MGIKILTDSTSNLSEQEVTALGIKVVSSYIFFGSEEYREGVSLSTLDFVQKLKSSTAHPQTAPPTAAEFVKSYEELIKEGDAVIALHLTSKLSNIFRNSNIAKGMVERTHPEAKVFCIDTQLVDYSLGFLVKEAAKLSRMGKTAEEVVDIVQKMIKNMGGFIYVDTLEFLKRGGRVSALKAFLGTLMNKKPILKLDDGELRVVEKVTGKEKGFDTILELMKKDIPMGSRLDVGVGDALCKEDGDHLLSLVRNQFQCVDTSRASICQSVTIHTGPGAVAMFYHIL